MSFLLKNSIEILQLAEINLKLFRDLVHQRFDEEGYGISYEQWSVLSAIAEKQGVYQYQIANKTNKETASISRILKLLEKKELVQKLVDNKNKRAKLVYLTPQGLELQKKSSLTLQRVAKESFKDLHDQETNLFVRILEKLNNKLTTM